jgi:S-DNA-T family DNA segregation ATPase FtsK/SpoIIIE
MGDPKLDYDYFRPYVERVENEPLQITQMVTWISEQINTRIKKFKDAGTDKIMEYNQIAEEKEKYWFIIVDEVLDFPTDNKDFWKPMSHIARKGRSAGIYVLFVLHRAANDMFPLDIRNNISNRIVMRVENPSDSEIGLGDSAAYHLPPKAGRAIFKQERLRQIQIPYISKDQVRAILHDKRKTQEVI